MPELSRCKSCGETIFWLESKKTGKKYPVDDENNPTAFHSKTCKKPIGKTTTTANVGGFTEDDRKLLRKLAEDVSKLVNHPIFK